MGNQIPVPPQGGTVAKKRKKWPWIVGLAVGAIAIIAVAQPSTKDGSPAPTSAVANPPQPVADAPTEQAGPGTTINGDGTFLVGVDFVPGTYKSASPKSGMCSWARLNKMSSITDMGAIILNGNNTGQGFVTIEPSDVAFATQLCETWEKVG